MVCNCRTDLVISYLLAHLNTDNTDWENAYNIPTVMMVFSEDYYKVWKHDKFVEMMLVEVLY